MINGRRRVPTLGRKQGMMTQMAKKKKAAGTDHPKNDEGRIEQINVRMTPSERQTIGSKASLLGFRGEADYLRFVGINAIVEVKVGGPSHSQAARDAGYVPALDEVALLAQLKSLAEFLAQCQVDPQLARRIDEGLRFLLASPAYAELAGKEQSLQSDRRVFAQIRMKQILQVLADVVRDENSRFPRRIVYGELATRLNDLEQPPLHITADFGARGLSLYKLLDFIKDLWALAFDDAYGPHIAAVGKNGLPGSGAWLASRFLSTKP